MDILSIIGLLLAPVAIILGAILKGAGVHALVSSAAFMIVVVGTVAAICVQTPMRGHAARLGNCCRGYSGRRAHEPDAADQEDRRLEQHRAPAGAARARAR